MLCRYLLTYKQASQLNNQLNCYQYSAVTDIILFTVCYIPTINTVK